MIYIVNYDLQSPSRDYKSLYTAISAYRHSRIAKSCLLITSSKSSVQIRDDLGSHMDQNDVLFVCDIRSWDGYNLNPDAVEHLTR